MSKTILKQRIILVILGVLFCIILLEVGLRIGGFIILSWQEYKNRISLSQKGEYRILCLGDSMTFRQYPDELERILNERILQKKFIVIDKGIPGVTTDGVLSKIREYLDKYDPHMVITMMGVNDWTLSRTVEYEDTFGVNIILFLKNFRIYKLTKLLQLHIVEKIKGRKIKEVVEEEDSKSKWPLFKLAWWYKNQGEYNEAEKIFKQIINSTPQHYKAHIGLGASYISQGKFKKAEEILKKAIEINPNEELAYSELGWLYSSREKYEDAERMCKKVIKLNPYNYWSKVVLSSCYIVEKKYKEAEKLLKDTIIVKSDRLEPHKEKLYAALALCYKEQGKHKLAEEYFSKVDELRMKYFNPETRNNYKKLIEKVIEDEVTLIAMQYPMRSIKLLEKMLDDNNVIFVDNEKIFKNAIEKSKYEKYFKDNFGGDFGHCTDKGNKLLARNIVDVILKEIFNK